MKLADVTVVVLSGGKSSRFWPLPHKMLMNFLGKTFIEHQIEFFKKQGFADIILVGTYDVNRAVSIHNVKKVLQQGSGQGAAILSAKKYMLGKPTLIVNADDIVSASLFKKLATRIQSHHHVLVGYKTEKYFPGGYLDIEGKRIVGIAEKPGMGNEPSPYVRLVCDFFTTPDTLIYQLEKTSADNDVHYEQVLSDMMKAGELFEMLEHEDIWIPIKYPWNTLRAMEYFLQQQRRSYAPKSVQIHKTVSISGTVVLGKNVRILEYTKIVGPIFIDEGTIIGNHSIIRASMIGKNSVVGFNSDVTRSYLGNNVWLHSNYVGDSILASNVAMGAGTTLANLRLDEGGIATKVKDQKIDTDLNKLGAIIGEGSRLGVGCYTMPGVKIGSGSMLGAGVLLQNDLEDKKLCFVKQEHTIQDRSSVVTQGRDLFRNKI